MTDPLRKAAWKTSEQPKSAGKAVIADTPPRATPLVGREPELRAVLDRVDQAPATGLVVVQVSGEPGIGKTSLLAEIARRLRERRCGVLTSASDVLGKRIPYGAVAALIRSLPPDTIRADALAALEISGNEDSGAWFGRACDRVVRLLTELTATRPAALLIDDLDHVDDDSLALLTLVLRRLSSAPLVLVTASRSADAVLLDRVEPYAEVVRLDLAPLSGADVARIVEAVLQTSVDEGLAREVQQRSDGNPFFVTEIARSLRELDLVTVDGNRARLAVSPDAIRLTRREALLRRVAPLENDTRLVARAVSVFRRVRLDQISLLARVASLPEETVVAAFDELLRVHIVVHDDNGYRFSHALVGEALYHEVGPAQRRHLHSLISARLLDDRAQGLPVDLLQLAWHLAESAVPGDRVAVGVLAEAAAHARASAPETAAALCFRALQLLPRNAPERAELLALQCRVLARASRPALAIDPGLAALESLQPGSERTRVATAVISSLFSVGRTAEAMALADAEVARGDAPASLEAQRAVLLVYNNRHDDAVSEVARIEALPISSPAEGVIVFEHLAMLTSLLFQHDRTVEYANRALAYSDGQPMLELQALSVCASISALAGLVHDASWRVRRAEDLLDQVGSHGFRAERAASRVALDWLGGRWDAALDGIGRWLPDVEAAQADQALGVLQAIELSIRTWRGELDVAARLASLPAPQSVNISRLHAVSLAEYLIARGRADEAYALLDDNVGLRPGSRLLVRAGGADDRARPGARPPGGGGEGAGPAVRRVRHAGVAVVAHHAPPRDRDRSPGRGIVAGGGVRGCFGWAGVREGTRAARVGRGLRRRGADAGRGLHGVPTPGRTRVAAPGGHSLAGARRQGASRAVEGAGTAHRGRGERRATGAAGHAQPGHRGGAALQPAHDRGVPVADLREAARVVTAGARPRAGRDAATLTQGSP